MNVDEIWLQEQVNIGYYYGARVSSKMETSRRRLPLRASSELSEANPPIQSIAREFSYNWHLHRLVANVINAIDGTLSVWKLPHHGTNRDSSKSKVVYSEDQVRRKWEVESHMTQRLRYYFCKKNVLWYMTGDSIWRGIDTIPLLCFQFVFLANCQERYSIK